MKKALGGFIGGITSTLAPVALAQPSSPTITFAPSVPVPAISSTMLIALAIVLAGTATWLLKSRHASLGTTIKGLIVTAAFSLLVAGTIDNAEALVLGTSPGPLTLQNADGETVTLAPSGVGGNLWQVVNPLSKSMTIIAIDPGTACSLTAVNGGVVLNTCTVGKTLASGGTCDLVLYCVT